MLIAIDPGLSGGIVYTLNEKIYAEKMPDTPKKIYDKMSAITLMADGYEGVKCYIEKTGSYRSGNSGVAAAKFARHCGNLESTLIALRVKYVEVTPKTWMDFFVGKISYDDKLSLAKKKTIRKNIIKTRAQALYPELKVTLALSDALGILNYAINKEV